jgi:hypothetical protein
MWGLPRWNNQLVTITLQPQVMTCSLIGSSKQSSLLTLHAYKKYTFQDLELEKLIVFNPTKINHVISNFLDSCNAQRAFVACALRGPQLFERFVAIANANPSLKDLALPEQTHHMLWDHRFIYPADNGLWVFYVTGIPRSMVLQYQLLAITMQLNLVSITSERMALLT